LVKNISICEDQMFLFNCKTHKSQHKRKNSKHQLFLELLEYGNDGGRTFVILQEGREVSRWANCLAQLRKLEKFFEKKYAGGKQVGSYKLP
jgi:negative regulator of genetic competence, sporulation and motility